MEKVISIILAFWVGHSTSAIAFDDLVQSLSNPALASIEAEVSDAVDVSYASAYWSIAQRLRRHTDKDLQASFWSRADETLRYLSNPNEEVAEVRRVLAYERDHPDSIMGWFDRERHSKWLLQAGFEDPVDSLNKTYFGSSRRTCRVVAAIILDKTVAALKQMEIAPTSEAYWRLYASAEALPDALGACPEPGSSEDGLLIEIAATSFQLRRAVRAHGKAFLPPQRELPGSELEASFVTISGMPARRDQEPLITSAELLSASQRITEQSIRIWKSGPDNLILRTWNGVRKQMEYWPD